MAGTTYKPSEMAAAILAIPGGIDTSDATAAADEILAGRTAYVNGVKIVGTATFAPTGQIITMMGKTAPTGYLACDGGVYDIADYAALAAYFAEQFEAANYFGGDGETTFAVPDLRGEFLRGSGTNSRENQGSGADVGTHQDATEHLFVAQGGSHWGFMASAQKKEKFKGANTVDTRIYSSREGAWTGNTWVSVPTDNVDVYYTSRPTNTSLLVCIKT